MVITLTFLSAKNIVHRDIKPENILISKIDYESQTITIKLADFGLVRHLTTVNKSIKDVEGTPYYMAKEIVD